MSSLGKIIDRSISGLFRARREKWEVTKNVYGVSLLGDKNVVKLDSGVDCITE